MLQRTRCAHFLVQTQSKRKDMKGLLVQIKYCRIILVVYDLQNNEEFQQRILQIITDLSVTEADLESPVDISLQFSDFNFCNTVVNILCANSLKMS